MRCTDVLRHLYSLETATFHCLKCGATSIVCTLSEDLHPSMRRMRSGFKHCAIPIDICRWEYTISPPILQDLQGPQQGGSIAVDVTVRGSVRFVHLPHYGGFNHGVV
ncbi:hypothetical protein CH8/96_ORF58R [Testudo hermanni ranavirus]|uniref:Uncharacterized protein n=1 Tax=Testudo hermanni ranavirus TaxID=89464 RepID=A0A0D3R388_9VIRU|nr:hypothetical protein CH8/96_ORF58R [Testudo hermanni ranavirus]